MPIYKMEGRKNGLQQYRVRVNYRAPDGSYKQIDRVAYGREEAKQLEAQLRADIGESKPVSQTTLGDLCDEYLAAKAQEVRTSSLEKSERCLRIYVRPSLGGVKLSALTPARLQKWKNEIGALDLALITKKNQYRELNALLNWAVRLERIPRNPLKAVGNFSEPYFEKPEEKLHYYTAEQYLKFAAAARESGEYPYYVFFSIAFYTGMRKGEINALRWSDIDGDTLHVRRSITQKLKGGDVETPPKNKSSYRDLQIPRPLADILADQKARQQSDARFSEDFRVCGGAAPLRDTSIENKNKAFGAAAGLPHIRVHDFRHTHASLLVNEGISIQEIARRLGHSKVEITWNTYAHLYPREEERAVQILNEIV